MKTKTVLNVKILVFVICVAVIKYLLLHNLLDCTFKNMDKISKVLKSSKHHNIIWFQMKEHLNIQYLFIQYFSYQVLWNQKGQPFIHFFSFVLNVILKLSRIFGSIKYHLRMRVKDFLSLRLEKEETLKYHCVCRPSFWKV